jgi:hypothetical protein
MLGGGEIMNKKLSTSREYQRAEINDKKNTGPDQSPLGLCQDLVRSTKVLKKGDF